MLWKLISFTGGGKTSKTVDFLRFCANDSEKMTTTTTVKPSATQIPSDGMTSALTSLSGGENETQEAETIYPEVDTNSLPWVTINNTDDCDAMFEEMQKLHSDIAMFRSVNYGEGLSNLDQVFKNGSPHYRKKEKYKDCFAAIDEAQGLVDSFQETLKLSFGMTESDSIDAALSYGEKIMTLYDGFLTPKITYDSMDTKIKQACSWVQELMEDTNAEMQHSREEILKSVNTFERASIFLHRLIKEFNKLNNTIHEEVYSVIKAMANYTSGGLTKLELTEHFTEDDKNNLIADNNEVKDLVRGYLSEMEIGEETLTNAYKAVLELEIPIFNRYTISKLELAKKLFKVNGEADSLDFVDSNTNGDDQTESSENSDDYEEQSSKFLQYLEENMETLVDSIKDIGKTVITKLDDVISKIQILSKNLQDYKTSTVMDSEFYL